FDAAVIDAASVDKPLDAAQRMRSRDRALQLVVVADDSTRGALERSAILRPGLGEVWIVGHDRLGAEFPRQAATVTRQRRAGTAIHRRIEHDLAALEPQASRRAFISDAYLAALLSVLPAPVISVDDE